MNRLAVTVLSLSILTTAGFAEARKRGSLILETKGDKVCSNKFHALKENLPKETASMLGLLDDKLKTGKKVFHEGVFIGRTISMPGKGKTLDVDFWNMGCLGKLKTCPTKSTSGPTEILVGRRGSIQYYDRKKGVAREMVVCVNKEKMIPLVFKFEQPAGGRTLLVETTVDQKGDGLVKTTTLLEIDPESKKSTVPRNYRVLSSSKIDASGFVGAPAEPERVPAAADPIPEKEEVPEVVPAVS